MANGLLDFFSGGGQYADPNQIDPNTGAPYGAVRQAFFNQLGNVGAALLAAGQPVEPAIRAQLLSQIGGFGSGMQRDIFNASQSRLMQSQVQTAEQERQRIRNLGERIKDPQFIKSLGLTKDEAEALGPKGIADVLEKKAVQDPSQRALTMLQLQKTQGEIDDARMRREAIYRYQEQQRAAQQGGGVSTTAPAASSTPGTFPSQPVAPGGMPTAAAPMAAPGGAPAMMGPATGFLMAADPMKAAEIQAKTEADIAKGGWTTITPERLRQEGYMGQIPPGTLIQRSVSGEIRFAEPKDPMAEARSAGYKGAIEYVQKDLRPQAQKAADTILPNIYRAERALNEGAFTGAFAEGKLGIQKVARAFGLANADKITNTEELRSAVNENVLPFMQAFGGSDTIEEMRLVQDFIGGRITLDESSMRRIFKAIELSGRRAIDRYNQEREAVADYLPKGSGAITAPERPLPTAVQPDNVQRRPPPTGGMGSAQPPVPGAQLAPDGNWYVKQGNQYFLVK